ncbi:hypothetical protein HWI79_217 [Cryptosporidium felis]|nr:hypothetical protein HWI79_217 [Cryptosporidium felis]
MIENTQDGSKFMRGASKLSASPLINENIKEIILLTQEITNVYDDLKEESTVLRNIKLEIFELEGYINSLYNKLQLIIKDIRLMESSYLDELESRENDMYCNGAGLENNFCAEENKKYTIITQKCEEFERELSEIRGKYALLLEKKKNLLKSMRDSEDVLSAKKKMYQSISMISWSLISDSFIQGHFIPIHSPTRTETFQLQICEKNKVKNAQYLWSEIEKF